MPLFSRIFIALLLLLIATRIAAAPSGAVWRSVPYRGTDLVELGRPNLRTFTDQNGLPQNAIHALVFDRQGYLWAGTKDGAARYDGRAWTVVNMPTETGTNEVNAILFTADGSAWFGTAGGVARREGDRWTVYNETNSPMRGGVAALLELPSPDGGPAVLASANNGLVRFEGGAWRDEGILVGDTGPTCLLATTGPGGKPVVWAGSLIGGTARLEDGRWTLVDTKATAMARGIISLLETTAIDGRRTLVAGTFDFGLLVFDGTAWRPAEGALANIESSAIHCMLETRSPDNRAVLWAASARGLWRFANDRWQEIDTSPGQPPVPVWSLARIESTGGTAAVWVGTAGAGVVHWQLGRWTAFDETTGLDASSIYSLLVTQDDYGLDTLWVGSNTWGLYRLEGGTWTRFTDKEVKGGDVSALAETTDASGRRSVWAATALALNRLKDGRWTSFAEPEGLRLPANTVRPTTVPGVGEALWVGTNHGLFRVEDGMVRPADPRIALPEKHVSTILETTSPDGATTLWIGTIKGLVRFENGVTTVYDSESGLQSPSIKSLYEHRSKSGARSLWIGTPLGLAILDLDTPGASLTNLSTETAPALPNNMIYRIEGDAQKRVYLFTNKGVARLTPREPTPDDPAAFSVYTFTTLDGLPSNECNTGASTVDHRGRIWAGTIAGPAVFDPSKEVKDKWPRPLVLTRALLPDLDRRLTAGDSLAHDENHVLFELALLSYFREDETRYRVQLVGFDDHPTEWSAQFKWDYISLPPGEYTFTVWARDALGNVSGPVGLPFMIRSSPWLTPWAMLLYVMLGIGLGVVVFRVRTRALQRHNEQLEAGIAERTTQLAHTVDELRDSERRAQEANLAKSTFLANMSHELRTPLNAILGFVQVMEGDASLARSHRESLGIISRSGQHLLGLINDVLSIAKIEAGRVELVEQNFDLHELLRTVREMMRIRAEAKGLEVELALDPALPVVVCGDEAKLRQVLVNLVGNAVKFTDVGHVTLRARWEGAEAGEGPPARGRAVFDVCDTGYGISEEDLGRLFEAFVQTESGVQAHEGTGLGLVISRNFVRLMGGDIRVESSLGEGTTFSFDVELAVTSHVDRRALARRRVVGLAPGEPERRILVVDDTDENRLLLRRLLEATGFEVHEAANGEEAVAEWEAWRPHLIWMDMRMPVMNGLDATVEIRRSESAEYRVLSAESSNDSSTQHSALSTQHSALPKRCVIVALTASAFEHERERFLEAGCDDFVPKPFETATIFAKMADYLDARYVYDEGEAADAADAPSPAERVKRLPPEFVEPLRKALLAGDPSAAMESLERVREREAALADHLAAYVRNYQFDEILEWIE